MVYPRDGRKQPHVRLPVNLERKGVGAHDVLHHGRTLRARPRQPEHPLGVRKLAGGTVQQLDALCAPHAAGELDAGQDRRVVDQERLAAGDAPLGNHPEPLAGDLFDLP